MKKEIKHEIKDEINDSTLTLRKQFLVIINNILKNNGWNQEETSIKLDVTQPRVSNLRSAHANKFSIEFLVKILMRLGYDFSLQEKEESEEGRTKKPKLIMNVIAK